MKEDNFKKSITASTLRITGEINNFNYSSILTKLIQEVGRFCESYASDLFIDWKEIDRMIKDNSIQTSSYLFGIRKMGVDHKEFIFSRYESEKEFASFQYRKIYKLDIVRAYDYLTMCLYEVDIPYRLKE